MVTNQQTGTCIDEVAAGIYRISTPVEIPALPGGFSFNRYLIVDDEPTLFHTGLRRMFPLTMEAIQAVIPVERLRYIGYSHHEADESGALNEFLAVAPNATPLSSEIGALVNLNDLYDRPGRGLADGESISIGSRELQWFDTPHVPHGWDCGVMYDKLTGTLLCGDLFTQGGSKCPPITETEVLSASEAFRGPLDYFSHGSGCGTILEKLAQLNPKVLACMHGSAYRGDGGKLLRELITCL